MVLSFLQVAASLLWTIVILPSTHGFLTVSDGVILAGTDNVGMTACLSCSSAPFSAALARLDHPYNRIKPVITLLVRAKRGSYDATVASLRHQRLLRMLPSSEEEMEALVVSLSREATDEARRNRVAAVFSEALSAINDPSGIESGGSGGASFSALFDQVLIAVGDRVKKEMEAQQMGSSPPPSEEKGSSTSYQLWALVDMMVQSKTIVKKARGELGKEGSFG
jgi:hypothetical protein